MIRLPLEMLLMIFEKIDFINLIKLRSICKDWKSIIDNNRITKELFIDYIGDYENSSFRISNNNIIFLDQFKLDCSEMFKKILSSNVLLNLKYLDYSFKCNLKDKSKLINLNCFKLLEHLVLRIELSERSQKLLLVHPNVKCLSVLVWTDSGYDDLNMEINCPKCEKLKIGGKFGLSHYDIIYPERVKIFKFAIYEENKYEIDKFINIETLEIDTDYLDYDNGINSKISKLSKLKKISVKYDFTYCKCDGHSTIELIRNLFYDLIDNDLISEKQIQLFFNNKEVKSKEQIEELIDKELGCPLDRIIDGYNL